MSVEEDTRILAELRNHLEKASDWANEDDKSLAGEWSCISSTLAAVKEATRTGRVGLALERWNDLSSPNKPQLSLEAQSWKRNS